MAPRLCRPDRIFGFRRQSQAHGEGIRLEQPLRIHVLGLGVFEGGVACLGAARAMGMGTVVSRL